MSVNAGTQALVAAFADVISAAAAPITTTVPSANAGDAMRACGSGDPERTDLWGNSALHLAAGAGHLECVSFLADMDAGLWALDNNFHSALELAALRANSDCVALLDAAIADRGRKDPRGVTRAKEKARREAEKRVGETTKLQEKHQKRMERTAAASGTQGRAAAPAVGSRRGFGTFGTFARIQAKLKIGTVSRAGGQKEAGGAGGAGETGGETGDDAEPGKRGDGWEKAAGGSMLEEQHSEEDASQESVFNRPGLGNMVFRRNFLSGGAYNVDSESVRGQRNAAPASSSSSADATGAASSERPGALLAHREDGGSSALALQAMWDMLDEEGEPASGDGVEMPWEDAELDLDDNGGGGDGDGGGDGGDDDCGPLDAFLASAGAEEFAPACRRERLDLEAMLLCSEGDLATLGLPLGPRKRVMAAVDKRRRALATPAGVARDTKL
uniref:Ankyrin repeat and SAM domain-containing protein 4B-like n=1 Tax=Petromyzon marinus TaxID=7757 RepID=A0AAJ7XF21_PETMA|nr:ankyrin repeat and SAM domain-containing protein 4B-like [Petromyzon marinus]